MFRELVSHCVVVYCHRKGFIIYWISSWINIKIQQRKYYCTDRQVIFIITILTSGHYFTGFFFPDFRNKRLFQEAFEIIFFISFPYDIGLVYAQVDTKSIESILVLSLLTDWSFHLALKSCLSKENYCWWPVSNACSWAGNEHNWSASVNQDKPSFTPWRNCGWNTVKHRDFLVQALQALFSNCRHLRVLCFSHECCLLLSLVLCEKCKGLQSPWVFPTLHQWQTGMGGDAPGSTGGHPTADKNHVPLRLHTHCLGDPLSKVALATQACMNKKYGYFLLDIFGCLGNKRIIHLKCNWIG